MNRPLWIAVASALLLSACGGGGGGSAPPTAPGAPITQYSATCRAGTSESVTARNAVGDGFIEVAFTAPTEDGGQLPGQAHEGLAKVLAPQ